MTGAVNTHFHRACSRLSSMILIKLMFVFMLLWSVGPDDYALARVIAGETPGCPLAAKLAVANVHSRNGVWFGDRTPTAADLWAATHWRNYPDPSRGAVYMIHPNDAAKMPWLKARTARWQCAHTVVETWE